jgi:hypothetical protein
MKYEGRRLKAKAGKQFLENFSSVSLLHTSFLYPSASSFLEVSWP